MKQTAVEWYNEQLNLYGDKAFNKEISLGEYHIKKQELLQQAKEMEKQQYLKILPYDLNELANECSIDWNGEVMEGSCSIYKEGFQKALELLTFKSE
jgi:hypothetical protein